MTAGLPPHPPSELRPYQRAAIDAVLAARRAGRRRLLVDLPTGAGKTVIFSHLARLARRQVLVLAHREELLTQAREKLVRALGGDAVVEIERGALRASAEAKVLVCSIRSLHEERLARVLRGRDVGLIVYDECHHAAAEDNLRVLRQLGVFEPAFDGTLLGFTATTARGDGQGLDEVFEEVVYTRALPELIDDGYLAPLRGFRISTTARSPQAVARGPRLRRGGAGRGDRHRGAQRPGRALDPGAGARPAHDRLLRDGQSRAASGARPERARRAHGHRARRDARPSARAALRDFREGRTHVLTNVGVLTEGFDDPGVSCVAMARPTRSEGLYAQCVGRGTRLFPARPTA